MQNVLEAKMQEMLKKRSVILDKLHIAIQNKEPNLRGYGYMLEVNLGHIRSIRHQLNTAEKNEKQKREQAVVNHSIKRKKVVMELPKELTLEAYKALKEEGRSDKYICEQYGIDSNKMAKFKKENGLIRGYAKSETDQVGQQMPTTPKEKPIVTLVPPAPEADNELREQLKLALASIEELKRQNQQLQSEMWADRFARLSRKQAELDAHISNNQAININDFRDEHTLALIVELAEVANEEKSFKYWKVERNVDRAKLLEESVDVLHFVLSRGLIVDESISKVTPEKHPTIAKQVLEMVRVSLLFSHQSLVNLYVGFIEMLGFEWYEIEAAYDKKHAENITRQNEGY